MSAPSAAEHGERPASAPTGGGLRAKVTKAVAAVAAVAVMVFGANAMTKGDSSSASSAANGGPAAFPDQGGAAPQQTGAPGQGAMPPDMGTAVTGSTLTKLESVATAKYPGEVERAMQLSDGSYVVHVIQSSGDGEVHVLISKDFEITGTEQGGPPSGAPPAGQAAPSGTTGSTMSS